MATHLSFQKYNYQYIINLNNNGLHIKAYNINNINDCYSFEDNEKSIMPQSIFSTFREFYNIAEIIDFPIAAIDDLLIINMALLFSEKKFFQIILRKEKQINNISKKKKSFFEKIKEPKFILNAIVGISLMGISWKINQNIFNCFSHLIKINNNFCKMMLLKGCPSSILEN